MCREKPNNCFRNARNLLECGLDPNYVTDCVSAMHLAAGYGLQPLCLLLQYGGDPNIRYNYPRVTSFDALKQSTDICAHQITFSSRKFIILNKMYCFQSKHTFWEVREHLFCLKYRCQRVYVCRHHYFDRHHFRRLSLAVEENNFFHCSPVFTGCTLYCTRTTKDYQQFITKI